MFYFTFTSSALTGFVATTFLAGAEDWKDRACRKVRGRLFLNIVRSDNRKSEQLSAQVGPALPANHMDDILPSGNFGFIPTDLRRKFKAFQVFKASYTTLLTHGSSN
jgi:hypothetical protein